MNTIDKFSKYIKFEEINGELIAIVDSRICSDIGFDEKLDEYLSCRHIKINGYSDFHFSFGKIKNSIIEISDCKLQANSKEFFEFDHVNDILTELSDKFDYVTKNNTHVIIHSYHIDWSHTWCTIGKNTVTTHLANYHFENDGRKITFKCSKRFTGANEDFMQVIKIEKITM